MKILVVDDDPTILRIASLSLVKKGGHEVLTAAGGAEALALAAQAAPDLLLLDMNMPGLDGYETCRAFKADPRLAAIPVIFLSAETGPAEAARRGSAGALGFIAKPFNPATLNDQVLAMLR